MPFSCSVAVSNSVRLKKCLNTSNIDINATINITDTSVASSSILAIPGAED